MQQSLAAAVTHLFIDRGEVWLVLHLVFADVERGRTDAS